VISSKPHASWHVCVGTSTRRKDAGRVVNAVRRIAIGPRTIRMEGYQPGVKSARREPLPHRPPPLGLRRHYAAMRPETDQQPHPATPRMYVVCFVHFGSAGPADAPHPSGRSALMVWVGIHRPPRGGACFLSSRCYGDSWARLQANSGNRKPTNRQASTTGATPSRYTDIDALPLRSALYCMQMVPRFVRLVAQ
jgi:hypothetical protein